MMLDSTWETRAAAADLILRACAGKLARNDASYWDTLDRVAELLARGRCVVARLNRLTNTVEINLTKQPKEKV